MKLTTERLKKLIMEELAEQDMDFQSPNVDDDLMFKLEMFANHTRMSPAEKVGEILDALMEAGFLSKDPRQSQS